VRTSEEFDELLAGFRALNVQVGRRLFDLRWHRVSGGPADQAADQTKPGQKPKLRMLCLSLPDKDGGWGDVQWVEPPGSASKKRRSTKTPRRGAKDAPAEDRPVDLTKRQVVGQLCLPLDEQGERFTLGLAGFVTIPRGGSAAEALSDGEGPVGGRFRELSARAGEALSYQWKECLRGFISVFADTPASFWYALLFAAYGDPRTAVGPGGVPEEPRVDKPLSYSADLIERLGLNTDCPKLPKKVSTGPTPPTPKPPEKVFPDPTPPTVKPDKAEDSGEKPTITIPPEIDADPVMKRIIQCRGDSRSEKTGKEIAGALRMPFSGHLKEKLAALRRMGVFAPGHGYPLSEMGQNIFRALKDRKKSS
jgi:hypothetical protein